VALGFIALACQPLLRAAEPLQPAPLFAGLGDYHKPVRTTSERAQRYFDQGMVFLYGFNHAEAIRSFKGAAQVDPRCAMAFWGLAYAHGPNINAPMTREAVPKAWAALDQALRLAPSTNDRERGYIEALATRYEPEWSEDRTRLDQAYADAMRNLARENPDDLDASVLFAEALMDTTPWNYWDADKQPGPTTREFLNALESVLRRAPAHPGANHFYIHAVEAGPRPEWGIPSADELAASAPRTGHLIHMPSHIYARVGRYHDASLANERSISADRSYITACRVQGYYPGLYYPHNLHFLWFTTSIEGRSRDSLAAAREVAAYAFEVRCGSTPIVEAPRFRHLPMLVLARFGRWDELLEETAPAAKHALDRAMWHYARGIAFAAQDRVARSRAELESLRVLATSEALAALESDILPARTIAQVAVLTLDGKLKGTAGDPQGQLAALAEAVEAQDALPYMEPPYWYYPVRQSLGAAQLRHGHAAKAEATFREDLTHNPRNGWSLFGLAAALRAQGKTDSAEQVEREFRLAWKHADTSPDLKWF
jgi:tetratricopeptide (TPR) repeat protein